VLPPIGFAGAQAYLKLVCQWNVMLADLLVDVNGRAVPLVKVVDVSQLSITLRAERRSDGFYAVRDHVFMAWVWIILLTS